MISNDLQQRDAGSAAGVISRRSLLASLAALAVAAGAGCDATGVGGDLDRASLGSDWSRKTPFGKPAPPKVADSSSGYPAPYSLVDDCVLSEDYFKLALGNYVPDMDKIYGYPQNNFYVPEALLVLNSAGRNGALVQLYHDWTHDSAWAVVPVEVDGKPVEHVDQIVVGRPQRPDNTIGSLHVFSTGVVDDVATTPIVHIKQLDDSSWQVQPALNWNGAGLLHQVISPSGGVFVYSFGENTLYWCHVAADDSLTNGVVQIPAQTIEPESAAAAVYAPDGPDAPWELVYYSCANFYLQAWTATITLNQANQTATPTAWSAIPAKTQPLDPTTNQPLVLQYVPGAFTMDVTQPPIVFVMDHVGRYWGFTAVAGKANWFLLDFTIPQRSDFAGIVEFSLAARAVPTPTGQSSASAKALDLYLRTYTTTATGPQDNKVWVMHQVSSGDLTTDSQQPSFTPAIPLLSDIGGLGLLPGRATNTGFITMDIDGGLQVLTVQPLPADPTTGAPAGSAWVGAPIHLPADESIQVSSYRAQLTLSDGAGLPVGNSPLQVSCAQSVAALCNGAAVALGPNPVTLQTNSRGQVTLAIPADGLSCPTLSVSAKGVTASVQPSADVNRYCAGTAPLNQLPPLAAGGKITADRTLSADQFTSMKTAAQGAIDAPNVKPAAAARRRPARRYAVTPKKGAKLSAEERRLGSFLDDWVHDIVQAVKTAATQVTKVENQVATAVDYALVTITTDLEVLAKHELAVVIHDLDDAATVFHAVLNQIEAAVTAAIDWLMAAISGLLSDTAALALQYSAWIDDACTFATAQIALAKGKMDSWFAGQKTTIDSQLQDFATANGGATISKLVPAGQSSGAQGSRPGSPGRVGVSSASPPNPNGAHSNWLLDKIEQVFDGPGQIEANPQVEAAFSALVGKLQADGAKFEANAQQAMDKLTGAVTNPKALSTQTLGLFVDVLQLLVDGLITLADDILDLVFDLITAIIGAVDAILNTPIDSLPIIGPLLARTPLATMTFGHLACLLFAFPAMLAYKLANNGARPAWLQSSPQATARSFASRHARARRATRALPTRFGDAEDESFKLLAASTTMTWNSFDLAEAVFAVGGTEPPWWVTIADVVGAVVLGAFSFPGSPPYKSNPVPDDPGDRAAFAGFLCGMVMLPAALITTYVQRTYPGPANEGVRQGYSKGVTFLITGSGVLSAVFGIIADALLKKDVAEYFYTILYALPAALSPLLLTDGLPPAIVAGCCLIDIFAALYQLIQASLVSN